MFDNQQIALSDLPSLEELDWQPLHKSLIKQKLIVRGIIVTVLLAVSLLPGLIPGVTISPAFITTPAAAIISVLLLAWPFISVPRMGVAIRDKDIAYRHGVFWRSLTAIPFNRIQHVEIARGPLDRKFETASLQLFTAGGSSGDLTIHGLEAPEAERLRAYILAKIGNEIEQD